uniref:Uncharacterized protein n=2 Tax=unclassified bacterial viruses TaxID=12333 RepID=A0AAU6VZJ7_9VIRU
MKLPMPTVTEINDMAIRAEQAIYMCDANRSATKLIVENAIRSALAIVVDRMNIQIPDSMAIDLSKPQ